MEKRGVTPPFGYRIFTMKLLHINDQLYPNHETDAEQILSLMSAMGENGHDITLLIANKWTTKPPDAITLARAYQVAQSFKVEAVRSLFPTTRVIEKLAHPPACFASKAFRKAKIIHTRNLPSVLWLLNTTKKLVFYDTYRPWPNQIKALRPLFHYLGKHPRFLGMTTHSAFSQKSYLENGMPEEKLFVAHNGYDPKRMQPVLSKIEARRALGLEEKRKVVTYTGHVSMKKGLGLMLDLAKRLPEADFIIVGSQERGEVERQAERLANVRIVGWQSFKQTVPYLYAADVLFIPPTAGPLNKVGNTVLPIKTYLYLAAGRAIFAGQTPDLAEILTDGVNAKLVTPDDENAAFQSMASLLSDEALMNKLGENALLDAQEMTWRKQAERVVRFMQKRLAEADGL